MNLQRTSLLKYLVITLSLVVVLSKSTVFATEVKLSDDAESNHTDDDEDDD